MLKFINSHVNINMHKRIHKVKNNNNLRLSEQNSPLSQHSIFGITNSHTIQTIPRLTWPSDVTCLTCPKCLLLLQYQPPYTESSPQYWIIEMLRVLHQVCKFVHANLCTKCVYWELRPIAQSKPIGIISPPNLPITHTLKKVLVIFNIAGIKSPLTEETQLILHTHTQKKLPYLRKHQDLCHQSEKKPCLTSSWELTFEMSDYTWH
jgi:hypothetical protein